MSTPNTTTTPPTVTPPVETQTPSTTPSQAATTPANPSPSSTDPSAPGTSNAPAAAPAAPAAPAATPPAAPAAPAPGTPNTPPAGDPAEEVYELEIDENSPLSDEELNAITSYAEKYNLSKEDAQAMVAAQESLYTRGRSEIETRQTQELEQRRQALASHPDFSGEKARDSWDSVSLAVQAFGTPELIAALNDPNKRGYDLDVAIMLKNIGDQLKPESKPAGTGVAVPTKTAQDAEDAKLRRLYPHLYKDDK